MDDAEVEEQFINATREENESGCDGEQGAETAKKRQRVDETVVTPNKRKDMGKEDSDEDGNESDGSSTFGFGLS